VFATRLPSESTSRLPSARETTSQTRTTLRKSHSGFTSQSPLSRYHPRHDASSEAHKAQAEYTRRTRLSTTVAPQSPGSVHNYAYARCNTFGSSCTSADMLSETAVASFFTPTSQKPPEKIIWQERAPNDDTPNTLIVGKYAAAEISVSALNEHESRKKKLAAFDFVSNRYLWLCIGMSDVVPSHRTPPSLKPHRERSLPLIAKIGNGGILLCLRSSESCISRMATTSW
jgi:hypothetical protein